MTGRKAIFILMTEYDTDDRLLVYDAFCESRMASDLLFVQDGMELLDYLNGRNKFTNPQQSPRPGLILLDLNMPRKDGCKDLQEIERFKRYGRPFSLIFIDVDHFKVVNNRHGRGGVCHPVGLRAVDPQICKVVRQIGASWRRWVCHYPTRNKRSPYNLPGKVPEALDQ
jgi:PleD family two-component response regulator